jgi:hypothetical protein
MATFHTRSCLLLLLLLLVAGPAAGAAEVSRPALRGTFIQLLDHHRDWTEAQWQRLFADLQGAGIEEVYVQWSVFDRGTALPLEALLGQADAADMRVWVGLVHDPAYGESIRSDTAFLDGYLRRLRQRSLATARDLLPGLRPHTAFQGWYIPEEIDDVNWLSATRKNLLARHLRSLAAGLKAMTPEKGVAISGFSNAHLAPAILEKFWRELLTAADIDRLLFQDGIGAQKLRLAELPLYLQAVRRAALASGRELQVIVELFRQTTSPTAEGGSFAAVPAPFERILAQMRIAAAYETAGIVAFSVPEYMTPAAGPAAGGLFAAYLDYLQGAAAGTGELQ